MNPTTNIVEVLDTWNPSSARFNQGDQISDVGAYSTDSQNGRISCSYVISIHYYHAHFYLVRVS